MTAAYIGQRTKPYSQSKTDEIAEINKVRKAINLRLITMGFRDCLSCFKEFFSSDLTNQKCCDNCRQQLKAE